MILVWTDVLFVKIGVIYAKISNVIFDLNCPLAAKLSISQVCAHRQYCSSGPIL
jgi:hypothetical protein